jgi:hypothetical protein
MKQVLISFKTLYPPWLRVTAFHPETRLYTLVMVDPDVPDPTNISYKQFLHWIVPNISLSALQSGKNVHYRKTTLLRGSRLTLRTAPSTTAMSYSCSRIRTRINLWKSPNTAWSRGRRLICESSFQSTAFSQRMAEVRTCGGSYGVQQSVIYTEKSLVCSVLSFCSLLPDRPFRNTRTTVRQATQTGQIRRDAKAKTIYIINT